jgi:membrane protease YdiL (CAAX protease family)
MFDKGRSRAITILGLLGVFSCVFSLSLLSKYSAIDFSFPLEKEKIISAADEFIQKQEFFVQPLVKKAQVSSDQQGTIYIQKKLGVEKAREFLKWLPLYYWQVDYTFPSKRNFLFFSRDSARLLVSPIDAQIIGFKHRIPAEYYHAIEVFSKGQAEAIAREFFNSLGFDISGFEMTSYSALEKKYILEWQKDIAEPERSSLKVEIEILGDKVSDFRYSLDFDKDAARGLWFNDIVNNFLFLFLNTLTFALGIIVLIVAVIKRKVIEWKFGLTFALLMTIAFLVNFLKPGYRREWYVFIFFFASLLFCVIDFIWTWIVACVARLFSKEAGLDLFPVKISSAILVSYVFFFSGIGFTMLFFVFVVKALNPIATLGFDSFFSEFPSAKLSCLIAPLLSLGAAVFEEVFFRALMISFLKKYLKKTIWAVLLSTIIWCFMHVSPIGYSDIYPGFVKGLILLPIGILFAYIFLRFGLVCAIVTHYLHDLVVIGNAYLEFSNFRYVNENVVIMFIAAIMPLLVAQYFDLKAKKCLT